jgi:hypothetical protein
MEKFVFRIRKNWAFSSFAIRESNDVKDTKVITFGSIKDLLEDLIKAIDNMKHLCIEFPVEEKRFQFLGFFSS